VAVFPFESVVRLYDILESNFAILEDSVGAFEEVWRGWFAGQVASAAMEAEGVMSLGF
jgi:hypothetical protein